MRIIDKRKRIIIILCACILFFVGAMTSINGWDYPFHRGLAYALKVELLINPIEFLKDYFYPLWYILVKFITIFIGQDSTLYGCMILSGILVASTFVLAYKYFLYEKDASIVDVLATFMICVVGPIYLPWFNNQYFVGQSSPNVWHNPTALMVKPISLVALKLLFDILKKNNVSRKKYVILSIVLVLANMAKPNFAQILYPTVFLYCIYKLYITKMAYFTDAIKLFLCCLPSALYVVLQYIMAFFMNSGGEGVEISFLRCWSYYSPNVLVSIILVLLFPIFEIIRNIINKKISFETIFVWVMLLVAMLEYMFISEKGGRAYDGNFGWGYQLALFFVWMMSIQSYVDDYFEISGDSLVYSKRNIRIFYVEIIILLLHFMFGFRYICMLILGGVSI